MSATEVLLWIAAIIGLAIVVVYLEVAKERRDEACRRRSWRTLCELRQQSIDDALLLATPGQLAKALGERCGLIYVLLSPRPIAPGVSKLELSFRGLPPEAAAKWCRLGACLCVKPVSTEEN